MLVIIYELIKLFKLRDVVGETILLQKRYRLTFCSTPSMAIGDNGTERPMLRETPEPSGNNEGTDMASRPRVDHSSAGAAANLTY